MRTMTRRDFIGTIAGAAAFAGLSPLAKALPIAESPLSAKFRNSTLATAKKYLLSHGVAKEDAEALLSDPRLEKPQPQVQRVSESELRRKSYSEYKELFEYRELLAAGVLFHYRYGAELAAAQAMYGVPSELVAAVLGLESRYGQQCGDSVVANALLAQAENRPKRRREALANLASLVKLCKKYPQDPLSVLGSYKGALGPMQFMPYNLLRHSELPAGSSFEQLFSMQNAINLTSAYLARNGASLLHSFRRGGANHSAAKSYNPRDTPNYSRLIIELACGICEGSSALQIILDFH